MNLQDYAEQSDPMMAAIEQIETVIQKVETSEDEVTEEDWQNIYTKLVGQMMVHHGHDEAIRDIITEANKQADYHTRTTTLVADLKSHYSGLQSMVQQTATILGQFGVSGVKFV